jgi:hypothetical protein
MTGIKGRESATHQYGNAQSLNRVARSSGQLSVVVNAVRNVEVTVGKIVQKEKSSVRGAPRR